MLEDAMGVGPAGSPFPTGWAGEVAVAEALRARGWLVDHRGTSHRGGDLDVVRGGSVVVVEVRSTTAEDGRLADAGRGLSGHRERARQKGGEVVVVGVQLSLRGDVLDMRAASAGRYGELVDRGVAAGRRTGVTIRYPVAVCDLDEFEALFPEKEDDDTLFPGLIEVEES